MHRNTAGLLAVLAALAAAPRADAQAPAARPFSVEVRGGAVLPTGGFADEVGAGYTVGAAAAYDLVEVRGARLGVYAGYTHNSFPVRDDTGLLDDGLAYRLPGLDAGVRATLSPRGTLSPFLRGGLVYCRGDLSDDPDALPHDFEFGLDGAVGVEYRLGNRISATPAVGYTWVPGQDIGDAGFLRLDVGLRARL